MTDASSTIMGHVVLLLILSLLIGAPPAVEPAAYAVKWGMSQPSVPEGPVGPPYPVKWTAPILAASDGLHVEPRMLFPRRSLFPGAILAKGTRFTGDAAAPAPPRFVSPVSADAIPFGYKQLDTILRVFKIPLGSRMADQVAATLRTCEEPSREPHTCATSQQAAVAFAAAALGTSEPRAVVAVVHGEEAAAGSTRYAAVAPDGVARIGGNKAVVPCHPMPYLYMVHYCHRPAGVEALRVELTATGGGVSATAVAMCHADTRDWDSRYFRMLNATRGEEICHFMPRDYVLWLPAGTSI